MKKHSKTGKTAKASFKIVEPPGYERIMPRIELPNVEPTPEELERRREAIDRALALRASMPVLDISTAELIRQVREEEGG